MKKIIPLTVISLILFLFIISSQFPNVSGENLTITQNTSENASKKINDTQNLENIREKTNEALEKELIISQGGEKIIRGFLRISAEEIFTNAKIIVTICVLLSFIFILQSILIITPFFEGKRSWFGAIIITLLISITGVVYSLVSFLFYLANVFNILEKWSVLALVFVLLVLFAFFYGAKILTRTLKETIEKEKAEHQGIEAGTAVKILKISGSALKKKK